jgi:hypothetical protein
MKKARGRAALGLTQKSVLPLGTQFFISPSRSANKFGVWVSKLMVPRFGCCYWWDMDVSPGASFEKYPEITRNKECPSFLIVNNFSRWNMLTLNQSLAKGFIDRLILTTPVGIDFSGLLA